MEETTNYELPLYEGEDSPDLLECYNTSIRDIDGLLKTLSNSIAQMSNDIEWLKQYVNDLSIHLWSGRLFQPNKYSQDLPLTVGEMEYLRQDINGIIYNYKRLSPLSPPPISPEE